MWKEITIDNEMDISIFVDLVYEMGCSTAKKEEESMSTMINRIRNSIQHLMTNTQSNFYIYEDDDKIIILGFRYDQRKDFYRLIFVTAKYKSGEIGDENWNTQLAHGLQLAGEKFKEFMEEKQKRVRIGWLGEAKDMNKAVFLVPTNWIPLLSIAFAVKGVEVTKSSKGNANYLDFELA